MGLNQQMFDLGLPIADLEEHAKVEAAVAALDRDFALVMIAERMRESLVLLAALLCVSLADVAVMEVNARRSDVKVRNMYTSSV